MNLDPILERRAQVEEFQRKHRLGLLTLVFTDIVGSTALKQEFGDLDAIISIQRHHATVREVLKDFTEGEEIATAGDSFFIVFAKPSDAVKFSLKMQATLRRLAEKTGRWVFDRIGVHVGEVFIAELEGAESRKDLFGIQIDTTNRVCSLGEADQILLSRFPFDSARQVLKGQDLEAVGDLSWLNHGLFLLKGVEEPLEICEVGERGRAMLSVPEDSEKARRHLPAVNEPVLGWRPAVDQMVPGTDWVLERKLGEGGFGEVWLGRQGPLERRVFKFCFRADRVRSLKREVTLFRLLKERIGHHPNIVGVQDVYFEEAPYYIIMDYAEGEDLASWCETHGGIGKIPLTAILEIVAQIADALQAAHDAGIIHRDVKPSNILVNGDRMVPSELHVKLADFGIGHVVSEEALAGRTRFGFTETMLATGPRGGTHMYMAPELLSGQPATTRSDIYSLGVVLYQLLVRDLTRPLTIEWAVDVRDPAFREELACCLSGNPQTRFAGASLLARSLRSLAVERPRNVDWKRAAAFLYGDWGTSKAYVIGLAFASAQFASLPLVVAVSVLTGLVAYNYFVICRYLPDGGSVYSVAREHSRVLAVVGALMLLANFLVTAAISGWAAMSYFGVQPYLIAPATMAGILIVVGVNYFGPKHSGSLAIALAIPTVICVVGIVALSVPHLTTANLRVPAGGFSDTWVKFGQVILAISGVEAIASMTGVMKVNPGSPPHKPVVTKVAGKALFIVALEVVVATIVLGWAMLSLPDELTAELLAHKEDMLRFLGEHYATTMAGPTTGSVFGWVVGFAFGLLLLSAVNTAIVAMVGVMYVMTRDGELPRSLGKLNSYGVPLPLLGIAVVAPVLALLATNNFDALASLYAIGVVGAIAVTIGVCAFTSTFPFARHHRCLFAFTAIILICVETTIAYTMEHALFFIICVVAIGLPFLGRRQSR